MSTPQNPANWPTRISAGIGLCIALAGVSLAADKEKITWKPISDGILQVDGRGPKVWNLYRPGKKRDPLLLQIGPRSLVIYVQRQEVYEILPDHLQRKGEDLLWHEADKPAKPLAASDWSARDVGSAWRVRVKLVDENHVIEVQVPQLPDLRGIY